MVSVIVAFPKMENGKSIKNILVQHGFHVNAVCTAGAQVLQHADIPGEGIVICAARLQDMMCGQLREYLSPCFEMLVLAGPGTWGESMERMTYLSMPLKVHELVSTLELMCRSIARNRRSRKSRLEQRSEKEKQMIQQTKELLMLRKQMTEEEAHRYIQKSSMDSGTGLAEAAQMILSMLEHS